MPESRSENRPENRPESRTRNAPAEAREPVEPTLRMLDARALRGLAHPLRMQLLADLRREGPATASQLAERFGESSGSTSYHLRQLAAHGFVEDAVGHGKGRERWWQAAHEGTGFDGSLIHDADPATSSAAAVFLQTVATNHAQEVSAWISEAQTRLGRWEPGADLSDFTLRLTPGQSEELVGRLHDVVNTYRDLPEAEGTRTVRIHTHVLPRSASE
ncbi:helix-turn-helix domain-containing protein [Streptomyces erythrochromogenes]|uniref:helix-turn-helix domain-containing protein n=1 Tax=Streptomyces erythrochromogenes TaxID=285574 RepID=UPI00367D0A93